MTPASTDHHISGRRDTSRREQREGLLTEPRKIKEKERGANESSFKYIPKFLNGVVVSLFTCPAYRFPLPSEKVSFENISLG